MCVNIFRSFFGEKKPKVEEDIGRKGEDAACEFVRQHSFKVLARNWRTKIGEIDIVALKDGVLVIIEVKTSKKLGSVPPELRVNAKKQHKLKRLAQLYIKAGKLTYPIRFDVIGVWWENKIQLKHIENAFH